MLRTHWVMVVMDQHTRRIIGFGVQVGAVDGIALCRMFAEAIAGMGSPNVAALERAGVHLFEVVVVVVRESQGATGVPKIGRLEEMGLEVVAPAGTL